MGQDRQLSHRRFLLENTIPHNQGEENTTNLEKGVGSENYSDPGSDFAH